MLYLLYFANELYWKVAHIPKFKRSWSYLTEQSVQACLVKNYRYLESKENCKEKDEYRLRPPD